jgi:hypothetical protein
MEKLPNTVTLNILIHGLANLIAGQKQFAEEFGLSLNRLFPETDENLQAPNLKQLLLHWLMDDSSQAQTQLQQLFDALAQHQLALMAAIDGVALQTLSELTTQMPDNTLRFVLTQQTPKKWLRTLQDNQRLRYQKLIAPGFVESYIKSREAL